MLGRHYHSKHLSILAAGASISHFWVLISGLSLLQPSLLALTIRSPERATIRTREQKQFYSKGTYCDYLRHCYSTGTDSPPINPIPGSQAFHNLQGNGDCDGQRVDVPPRCIHRHRPSQIIIADKTLHSPDLTPVFGKLSSLR